MLYRSLIANAKTFLFSKIMSRPKSLGGLRIGFVTAMFFSMVKMVSWSWHTWPGARGARARARALHIVVCHVRLGPKILAIPLSSLLLLFLGEKKQKEKKPWKNKTFGGL